MKPSVLIPIAPGTNRNEELGLAFRAAGAETLEVPLRALRTGEVKLVDHQLLALPGGFSYGDALGAGRLLGLDLKGWFAEQLQEAAVREMPIIGICNGFQALVKAGLLPGHLEPIEDAAPSRRRVLGSSKPTEVVATLTDNENGRFECRWVHLAPGAAHSPWMAELTEPIRCPVAHGEGRPFRPLNGWRSATATPTAPPPVAPTPRTPTDLAVMLPASSMSPGWCSG